VIKRHVKRPTRPDVAASRTAASPGGVGLIYDFSVSHSYVAVAVGEEL